MTDADLPRLLVVGPHGQVGWELLRTLAPLGEVITAGRSGSNPGANTGSNVPVDLSRPQTLREAVATVRPAVVINAAAYTAVDRAEEEEALAMTVNATAPGVLAEACRAVGAVLVHYSTDYVFDGSKGVPLSEDDAPNPLNVYGRSKLVGEQAVAGAGATYLVLRTSWVYGLRGRNFLLSMRRLAAERDSLRIVDDQLGSPTWARMIAQATALLLARGLVAPDWLAARSGLYHLSAAGQTSWFGFARRIFELAPPGGRQHPHGLQLDPITSTDYPTPAARPRYSVLDNRRLRETFGLALPDWDTSLMACLADAELLDTGLTDSAAGGKA